MELKKYLLAGGIASVLVLGACNGDEGADTEGNEGMETPDESEELDTTDEQEIEDEVEEDVEEDTDDDVDVDVDTDDEDADADDEA